jgi:peptide chain release factor 1
VHEAPGITILSIEGGDLSGLDHEAGGHRIQRVPPTERKGRIHTSTVTVAIMDHTVSVPCGVDPKDVEISWFSGTGPGGQNRNKVMASCRLLHRPTGLTATAQTRSRNNSFDQAFASLSRKVNELARSQVSSVERSSRKSQIGSGQRGDKIRTIQFQNDTAIDHRTNRRITADQYLKGYMDRLWSCC